MVTYIAINALDVPIRVKMVTDKDCIPTDVTKVTQFHTTHRSNFDLYWYLRPIASLLENAFGFSVCIDLDKWNFYDSELEDGA